MDFIKELDTQAKYKFSQRGICGYKNFFPPISCQVKSLDDLLNGNFNIPSNMYGVSFTLLKEQGEQPHESQRVETGVIYDDAVLYSRDQVVRNFYQNRELINTMIEQKEEFAVMTKEVNGASELLIFRHNDVIVTGQNGAWVIETRHPQAQEKLEYQL